MSPLTIMAAPATHTVTYPMLLIRSIIWGTDIVAIFAR